MISSRPLLVCLLVACSLVLSASAHAQIGATPKEFQARYGSRVFKSKDKNKIFGATYHFRDGNVMISVSFLDGKAASVTYMKREIEDGNLLFTKSEIQKLLDRNSSEKFKKLSGAQKWKSSDGKIVAEYDDKNGARAIPQPPYNLAIGVLSVETTKSMDLRKQRTDEHYAKRQRTR
jgi:hypothetical protein